MPLLQLHSLALGLNSHTKTVKFPIRKPKSATNSSQNRIKKSLEGHF